MQVVLSTDLASLGVAENICDLQPDPSEFGSLQSLVAEPFKHCLDVQAHEHSRV